jgi:hypothetical protein
VIILLRFTLVADGISRLVVAPVAAPPSGTAGF